MNLKNTLHGIQSRLSTPIPIAPLVYFRIAFGAIMLWEVGRYFSHGWIARYYVDPAFHFTYKGFEWVKPWPDNEMVLHFYVLGGLAICILIGFGYRLSMTLFWLGFTYVFLLDKAHYLNHFYLISLISFLMIWLPAHRAFSVDAWLKPRLRSATMPTWALWILRFQIGIPYFYGGIAKLNPDWLHGEPMREWLAERTDFPLIGAYFTKEWMVYFFSYGGLLFDLLIVPLLLWRRTRWIGIGLMLSFHLINARLLPIGIFPWFMIAATLLFLDPARFTVKPFSQIAASSYKIHWPLLAALSVYCFLQLIIPLRHFLYPGYVSWTGEGYRFAWHMRLWDKDAEQVMFIVQDAATGTRWEVDPGDYLADHQIREMAAQPDMIYQFAQYLDTLLDQDTDESFQEVQIFACVRVSLNNRPTQYLIDPDFNLVAQKPSARKGILPLEAVVEAEVCE